MATFKKYKNLNNTTNHSMRRGNQRLGLTKNETKKMADRALTDGISSELIFGKLKEEVMDTCKGNVRYYANAVYIFNRNNHLITVIKVDPIYEKHLLDYVSLPVFAWYKMNRIKYKSNQAACQKSVQRLINESKQKIILKINTEFFADSDIKVHDIILYEKKGTVVVDTTDFSKIADLRSDFKKKYRMNLITKRK